MAVDDVTVNAAAVPLNVTDEAPVKFEPLIVTLAPTNPLAGVKLVTVGTAGTRFANWLRMFAVMSWIRGSTLKLRKIPGASSSAHENVMLPEAKTHAPLGA